MNYYMNDNLKIISILGMALNFVFAPLGFGLSLYAFLKLRKLKQTKEVKNWKTVSLLGVILGGIFSLISLLLIILFIGSIAYITAIDPTTMMPS